MKIAIILNSPVPPVGVVEKDVIFADGAYKHKDLYKDKNVIAVVGDFDTLKYKPEGVPVVSLNEEKDFTDGERAVRYAKEVGADEIVIYGATDGKIDHVLGNIFLLKIAEEIGVKAKIKGEGFTVRLICGKNEFNVNRGKVVSIIPFGDYCVVTDSVGLYYPLNNLTLTNGQTLGLSNKAVSEKISLDVIKGKALIVIYD